MRPPVRRTWGRRRSRISSRRLRISWPRSRRSSTWMHRTSRAGDRWARSSRAEPAPAGGAECFRAGATKRLRQGNGKWPRCRTEWRPEGSAQGRRNGSTRQGGGKWARCRPEADDVIVRPFLLLSSRPEDEAADGEYAAFLRFSGLFPEQLHRVRMEAAPLPKIRLDDWSGIFLGGGPLNSSDAPETKSTVQRRVESEVSALLAEVVDRDFPFFGACYGVGPLGAHLGGVVDCTYAEPVSAVSVTLTSAGLADPVLAGIPKRFEAFVGHKEACRALPPGAVLLATSAACPVQMFRVGSNVYATQFHPELDVPGIVTRVRVYQHAGYFAPTEMEDVTLRLTPAVVTEPGRMLANFVSRAVRASGDGRRR